MKSLLTLSFLILSFVFIGFVLVAQITGKFFVSTADGSASGAIVFFYGLIGALMGLVTAIFILRRSRIRTRRMLAIIGTIISLTTLLIFHSRYKQKQIERDLEQKHSSPTQAV